MTAVWIISIIGVTIMLILLAVSAKQSADKADCIAKYDTIQIGDSRESVMDRLGNSYTSSLLKDGREKCVWKLSNGGSTRVYVRGTGVSQSSYKGVQKITIYFKNGKVIERLGLNI